MALTLWSVMTIFAGETAYLFSYFINDSKDGLHLAYSYDGLNWTPLNGGRSFLAPSVGKDKLMRDPSICQAPDGTFHMVWTSSWTDRIIGYASSRDLIHWSEQQAIPVMMHEPEAHNCWAPELFYDEPSETYYIFWATTIPGRHKEVPTSESEKGLNHRMYYVTTKDFRTFSKTKMFFNPDFSVIDAAIVKDPTQGGSDHDRQERELQSSGEKPACDTHEEYCQRFSDKGIRPDYGKILGGRTGTSFCG